MKKVVCKKAKTLQDCKVLFKDGQPCKHNGCLSHLSHPCEGCGRIAGRGDVTENPFEKMKP